MISQILLRRWTVGALAAGALFTFATADATACSCRKSSRAETIAAASIAFDGTPIRTRTIDPRRQQTTFRVDRVIKGNVASTVIITTRISSAACGVDFRSRPGRQTIAAFTDRQGGLTTNACAMYGLGQ